MAFRLVSGVAVLALGACSLSISGPKPNRAKLEAPSCDTSKGLVALDSLVAIGLGIGGLAALGEESSTGAVLLVTSALLTGSALHGSGNADKCRDAYADYIKETQAVARAAEEEAPRRKKKRRPDPDEEPDEVEELADPVPRVPMPASHLPQPAPPPAVTPQPVTPQPVMPQPVMPQPVAPVTPPPPKKPIKTDDWSQFWREVVP